MSVLNNIKGFVFRAAREEEQEVKEAIKNFFYALDGDLDNGYDPSEDVDKAIEELDNALIQAGKDEDKTQTEEIDSGNDSKNTGDLPDNLSKDEEPD